MSAQATRNNLSIDAVLSAREDVRYTPAGVPVVEASVRHRSVQVEAGRERDVDCELRVKVLGALAKSVAAVPVGSALRLEGFLAKRHHRGTGVVLHLTGFELLRGN